MFQMQSNSGRHSLDENALRPGANFALKEKVSSRKSFSMKARHNLLVLKERMALAIACNCRAGGVRRRNMAALAHQVGVFSEGGDLERTLCRYVRQYIDARHARRLLTWLIGPGADTDAPAAMPVGIPKVEAAEQVAA